MAYIFIFDWSSFCFDLKALAFLIRIRQLVGDTDIESLWSQFKDNNYS